MMNSMRKHTKVILWIVVIAFVSTIFFVWGMDLDRRGAVLEKQSAAMVNDQPVSYEEFGQVWEQRYRQVFGTTEEEPDPSEVKQLRQDVIDELIDNVLLQQAAEQLGIRIFDEEIASQISAMPVFQENGRFSQEKYLSLLNLNRITPSQFEGQQRIALLLYKVRNQLQDTVLVSEDELRQFFLSQTRKLKIQYVIFNWENELPKVRVSEDRIRAYYQEHEKEFDQPEEVRASHILVAVKSEAPEEERLTAKIKLENIREEIIRGKSFAAMAKEHSDDPGSKDQGGDLGFFRRGMMVKAFEDAVFKLKPGQLSDVVETSFGYHLIQVTDRHDAKHASLGSEHATIEKRLREEDARQRAQTAALDFGKMLKANPRLQSTVDAFPGQVKLLASAWIREGDSLPGIKTPAKLLERVYELALHLPSPPLFIDDSIVYAEVMDEQVVPFNEKLFALERDALSERLQIIRSNLALQDWLAQARKDAKIVNNIKSEPQVEENSDSPAESSPAPQPLTQK